MSLLDATTSAPLAAESSRGSLPLKNAKHERYARFRARMYSMCQAAEMAGQSGRSGFCTKVEARQDVRDRIAWLTHEDEEILREGKREIEAFLWNSLRNDPSVYFHTVDEPVYNDEGKPVGTKLVQRLKPFDEMSAEARQLIEGLTYTEKGKPNLKIVSKLAASIELRKLKGLDAPQKSDVNLRGGTTIQVLTGVPRAPNEDAA